MKLKYRYLNDSFFLVCVTFINVINIVFLLIFLDFSLFIKSTIFWNSFTFLVFIPYFFQIFYFYIIMNNAFKKGEKKQGYIIDSLFLSGGKNGILTRRYRRDGMFFHYGFRVLVDNKSYYYYDGRGEQATSKMKNIRLFVLTRYICNNAAYKYICSELKKAEDMGNGKFKLRSFPIDVYVYNNKYYFDLDSVKLDK